MIAWSVICDVRYGKNPLALARSNLTVWSSTLCTPPDASTPLNDDSACESFVSSRLKVATTSSTVIGVPSWNLTPWRILNVQDFEPFDAFHEVASCGWSTEFLSAKTSCSPAMCETASAPSDWSSGG